jgi:hypothetical protein
LVHKANKLGTSHLSCGTFLNREIQWFPLTLGPLLHKANGELKSSIPIGAKDEISLSRGFPLGVKAETEKIISICPKLLIK